MTLPAEIVSTLRRFRGRSRFVSRGGIVTDLDGTALHERGGRLSVAETVAEGLKALADLGRPVVLNTLRFPLNVIASFGQEWRAITRQPMPLVSLNGSVFGLLAPEGDAATFQELAASPLSPAEVKAALGRVAALREAGLTDIVVFVYLRDWRAGEIIWTPAQSHVPAVRAKYPGASQVIAGPLAALERLLLSHEVCMLSIQADIPEDRRMAYQHLDPIQFVTTAGVDKLSGAREAAARLDFDLQESVGAGDTPMDSFLAGVGLAMHVGPLALAYRGRRETLRLGSPRELGYALFELAQMEPEAVRTR
jgi:hypothetical protein